MSDVTNISLIVKNINYSENIISITVIIKNYHLLELSTSLSSFVIFLSSGNCVSSPSLLSTMLHKMTFKNWWWQCICCCWICTWIFTSSWIKSFSNWLLIIFTSLSASCLLHSPSLSLTYASGFSYPFFMFVFSWLWCVV